MAHGRIWIGMALLGTLGCTGAHAPAPTEGRLRLVQFAPAPEPLPVAATPAPAPAAVRHARLRPVPRPRMAVPEPVPEIAALPVQAVEQVEPIVRSETLVASLRPDGTLVVDVRVLEGSGEARRWERTHLELRACPGPDAEID